MSAVKIGVLHLKMLGGAMFVLLFYDAIVLKPQIRFLERKIRLPEYQGTHHQKTMRFALDHLEALSRRLRLVILLIGMILLGIFPIFLR